MREIGVGLIRDIVVRLAQEANFILRCDARRALNAAFVREKNKRAKKILKAIIDNLAMAKMDKLAICQDTGLPVVFVEIGQEVHITGGSLVKTINQGINSGYRQGYLRNSIIKDPISGGKPGFIPAVIHTEIVPGRKLKLTVLPKGFGCENKSQVKMFEPTSSVAAIKKYIINVVKEAGPDACPPFVLGVGIGGTQDYACLLAKKALLKEVAGRRSQVVGQIDKLEQELLREINKLNIGPMGLGGKTTCLGVNIETYPTHIAGLPVAVNISCHALRSASKTLREL